MALPEPLDRARYAERFRDSQQLLMSAARSRLRCLSQLIECIEDCKRALEYAKQQHLEKQLPQAADPEKLEQTRQQLKDQLALSIIVFGRSNTGKSTLLNQILRQWPDQQVTQTLLPAAAHHNCSTRIAIVCHGQTNEARVIDRLVSPQTVFEQKFFTTTSEIKHFMELLGPDRRNIELLRRLVEIKLPQSLLQDQLRLVDSPGMGEDEQMNQVVRKFLESVKSGIIVYVVDGKEGYKPNPDIENINFLLEQQHHLTKLIVANRVDFDFDAWFFEKSEAEDLDFSLDLDPLDEIFRGLRDKIDFNYTEQCRSHTDRSLASVRQQIDKLHPDCLAGEGQGAAALVGVSAKSVKDFISGVQKLPYAPYVDSFLQFESCLAALVHENGRHHLLAAANEARVHLMHAKTLSIDFFSGQVERDNKMMQLLERSISTIRQIFDHICDLLNSVLDCDALDLASEGSELNRLKRRFVREDAGPEQAATDTALMMRKAEAQLIQSLVTACGGTREAKAAIRLLCDFKDAVVSRMCTILMWNYKMIFMVEANRPLSKLDEQCRSMLDSLKQEAGQVKNGQYCEKVIDMARQYIFTPDADAFSQLCTDRLSESLRQALANVTKRDEFKRIVDSLTQQFSRTEEQRSLVLTYFMENVDLSLQMVNVIHAYREQLNDQKVFVDNLLSAVLQGMLEQGIRTQDQLKSTQAHNDKMAAMTFYIDALCTEANWTADYDTSLQEFQDQCAAMQSQQSSRRLHRRLRRRFPGDSDSVKVNATRRSQPELMLHYRLVRLQQDDARRMVSDVAQISSRLAGQVRLSWLCLSDTYQSFMDGASVQMLIGFDGDYVSLAELPPSEPSNADRLAWLASLVDSCAKVSGADRGYRPADYRPSCVLLRRLRPGEGAVGLSGAAFPDPTRLLRDPSDVPNAVSLAACAVVLFTGDDPKGTVGGDVADTHGWDARHGRELRRLAAEDRVHYLAGLNRRLAANQEPLSDALVSAVARCVRVCLEVGGGTITAAEKLLEVKEALVAALPKGPAAAAATSAEEAASFQQSSSHCGLSGQ